MDRRSLGRLEPRRTAGRILLAVFAVIEGSVGVWAVALPRSFYDRFPGMGWHWARAAGPYDEHLVRDFGGALAGLALVTLVCAARPGRQLLVAVAAGWTVEAVPHFVFHVLHRDVLPTGQDVADLTVLALAVVAPLLALALLWPGPQPSPAGAGDAPVGMPAARR